MYLRRWRRNFERERERDLTCLHQPGIEPGSHRWQRCVLPLDHWCLCVNMSLKHMPVKDSHPPPTHRVCVSAWHVVNIVVLVCYRWSYAHVPAMLTKKFWEREREKLHPPASAGNWTRVTSMATKYSTTRPLMLMCKPVSKAHACQRFPPTSDILSLLFCLACC